MLVTLEETKMFLRVDSPDEDALILTLMEASQKICLDVLRMEETDIITPDETLKTAIFYGASYLYEHREEADYKELTLTLRCLLFGQREEVF